MVFENYKTTFIKFFYIDIIYKMDHRDEWEYIIELMDYNSIQNLSKTNKSFRKYVKENEEKIYKKLLLSQYHCINGYKDLYKILESSNVKDLPIYKKKCIKEGYLNCETLISDLQKFNTNVNISLCVFMKYINSLILCFEQKIKTPNTITTINSKFVNVIYQKINKFTLIINKSKKTEKEKRIWNEWYPIALHKLGSIYTPSRK